MLFHLFIFFSHMNWPIPSYSVGKLTVRMIHVHIVVRYRYCPSSSLFLFSSPILPFFLCLPLPYLFYSLIFYVPTVTCDYNSPYIDKQVRYAIQQRFTEHGNSCVMNSSLASHFFPSHFISFFFPFSHFFSIPPSLFLFLFFV